jgi:hypothetical protein
MRQRDLPCEQIMPRYPCVAKSPRPSSCQAGCGDLVILTRYVCVRIRAFRRGFLGSRCIEGKLRRLVPGPLISISFYAVIIESRRISSLPRTLLHEGGRSKPLKRDCCRQSELRGSLPLVPRSEEPPLAGQGCYKRSS